MANPWDTDEIVGGNPWDADEVIAPAAKPRTRTQAERMAAAGIKPGEYSPVGSDGQDLAASFGRVFANMGRGAQQFATEGLLGQAAVADASLRRVGMGGAADAISSVAGAPLARSSQRQAAQAAENARLDAPLMATGAGKIGNFAGNVAATAIPLARIGSLGRGAQYVASAGAGATVGALEPVADQSDRVTNIGIGTAAGALGQGVGDVLMASGRAAAKAVTPELRALYQRARAAGINLTPAQLSNSEWVKRVSAMLDKLPGSGAGARARTQQEAGNRELARLIGQNADSLTPQVAGKAADDLGKQFDQVFANGMQYDRQFLREVADLRQQAAGLDDTARNALDALIQRLQKQATNGAISGRTLQSIDRQARQWAQGGGDRQLVADGFRESLHEAFGRTAPAGLREVWDTTRRQWATLKTLEPVIARNAESGVPLQQIQGAVNSSQRGRTARARGRDGDLGKIASIGQRMRSPSTSGTAENLYAAQALNPLAWPLLAASGAIGLVGRGTVNNSALGRLMVRESRGQTRQQLSPLARLLGIPLARTQEGTDRPKKD